MNSTRKTDTHNIFRPKTGRFMHDIHGIWIRLREGERGPFPTQGLAAAWLNEFLKECTA